MPCAVLASFAVQCGCSEQRPYYTYRAFAHFTDLENKRFQLRLRFYPDLPNTAMPSSSQHLSLLATVAFTTVNAAMGPYFSTGPVASNSFIRESTATLVLPSPPSSNSGDLSLWVGMGTSNGDLIQSIAENWQSNAWSVYAYTLLSTGRQSIDFFYSW